MEKKKLGYEDLIVAVEDADKPFVEELHQLFLSFGCKIEIKEAKSGYVVSYTLNKKTVANYVFRKAGLIVRIYANHVGGYMDFLETLPKGMRETVQKAPICKRLVNPNDCNSRCPMGYDFLLSGEHYQKCRVSAFMFLMCAENNPYIKTFLSNELKACS